jgi:hypothetical protein
MIGFVFMIINIKDNLNKFYVLVSLGIILVFMPGTLDKYGVTGRYIFLICLGLGLGMNYFVMKDIC